MQQHPIPQNVTAYKFRLVGSMTLKQFLELAGGIVTAWIIFSSGLHFIFKWTLGPLAGFFGVALAFLPIEDRPLDQWLINFFKAIYNPTRFTFQSRPKALDIFSPSPPTRTDQPAPQTTEPGQLQAYLQSLPPSPTTAFDQAEAKYLNHVQNLFGALGIKAPPPSSPSLSSDQTPSLKTSVKGIRVRKLNHPQLCLLPHATIYSSANQTQTAAMPVSPPKTQKQSQPTTPPPAKTSVKPTQPTQPTQPAQAVKTAQPAKSAPKTAKPTPPPPAPSTPPVVPPPQSGPVKAATFATNIIFPQIDQKPNLITGVTLNQAGKIIPNVILEIKDNQGHPVRALKSNKLGQFFIATPIDDGIYQISAEHPDYKFAIMKLEAKGEVIPPLKIQSL